MSVYTRLEIYLILRWNSHIGARVPLTLLWYTTTRLIRERSFYSTVFKLDTQILIYTKMSSEQQQQQQQEQEPNNANTHNEFNAIIGRLKTAAKSDQADFNAISAEELQERLRKSRQIGFNVQASLEIEQARKRQLVETFLKREMKLPNTEDEEEKEEEKEKAGEKGVLSPLEASLAAANDTNDNDAGGDEDDEISRLKKQLAASQLDARKSLQIAKKTRAMCDRMVEMLKESGVEQLEQPKSI